jgi:hypothetical protein
MTDEFLTRFQAQPREVFVVGLYHKLAAHKPQRSPMLLKRAGLGFAMACAVLATVLVTSPAARAQVGQLIVNIAGFAFSFDASTVDPNKISIPTNLPIDRATAEAEFGQSLALPSYVPSEFAGATISTTKTLGPWGMAINFLWKSASSETLPLESQYLSFSISKKDDSAITLDVGKATTTEVNVNGIPAVLVENPWAIWTDESGKTTGEMRPTKIKMLMWKLDSLDYTISAGPNVSIEDMIRMAESVK